MSTEDSEHNTHPGGEIKEKSVDELIKAIEDCRGDYGFLIGAGTSRPAGIPTGSELIERWQSEAHTYFSPDNDEEDWINQHESERMSSNQSKYGFWFEQAYTSKEQRRDHIENEVVAGASPEFGHIVLASMMSDNNGKRYVPFTLTPNFDDLLYDAFYHYIEERPKLVHHNALASEFSLTGDTPTIVKVHGDYLYQNVKNLHDETQNLKHDIEDRIIQAIGEFGLIVIGYAGEDDSIMEPLKNATRSGEGVFWCVRKKDALSDHAKELLRQPNTFKIEIEGSETLFSKFFARIDGLQIPTGEDIQDRADHRANELNKKRDEAQEHAPEEDQAEFEVADAYEEAVSYRSEGLHDEALTKFEEIIEKEPDGDDVSFIFAIVHNDLGTLLSSEYGQFKKALDNFERALEIDPENPLAHYNIANSLQQDFDKTDEARDHYERALEIDPEYTSALVNLGYLLQFEFKKPDEARDYYERALEINDKDKYARTNLAYLLYREYNETGEAREHLEQALEIDPEFSDAHNHLAEILYKEYDIFEDARHHFERAIEINPEYAEAHYEYAEFLDEVGEEKEAEEHYERAENLDSESPIDED